MKDNELKAYRLGIQNALSCLNGLLNMDEQVVVHDSELDVIIEYGIDELLDAAILIMCRLCFCE